MITRSAVTSGRYVFAGNRAFVLERMIKLGLNIVAIWAVRDSYLERYLISNSIEHHVIESKEQLCDAICKEEFDYFISNGLPIILPIGVLLEDKKEFINIHPSLLPDLRGRDPVPGALLYNRDSGATCHIMDDGIDTGSIISQVRIPMTECLDAGLLYQLSFMAEADAFELAYQRGFKLSNVQSSGDNDIYYSFKEEDLLIDDGDDSADKIIRKVKAFSTGNKGARIQIDNVRYIVKRAFVIHNPYAIEVFEKEEDKVVLMTYEDHVVFKIKGELVDMQLKCEELYNGTPGCFPTPGSDLTGLVRHYN